MNKIDWHFTQSVRRKVFGLVFLCSRYAKPCSDGRQRSQSMAVPLCVMPWNVARMWPTSASRHRYCWHRPRRPTAAFISCTSLFRSVLLAPTSTGTIQVTPHSLLQRLSCFLWETFTSSQSHLISSQLISTELNWSRSAVQLSSDEMRWVM